MKLHLLENPNESLNQTDNYRNRVAKFHKKAAEEKEVIIPADKELVLKKSAQST